ncbi:MAG: polysaccharide deacetylase [Rhizobiales bacterium PAR1]|nr:MAG: polysaccharide deacetylase [Rhizobiales bacterium PAR1]
MLRRILTCLPLAIASLALASPPALAQACGPGTLGTSRVMAVSPGSNAHFGTKSYDRSLPLQPREVVLTFDDGPLPGPTDSVLDSLRRECVKATFFLIGSNAAANPGYVRRIAAEGHTLANHSMTHPWTMRTIPHDVAWKNILDGEAAIEAAAGRKIAPFFRFPGFADTPGLLDALDKRGIATFGTDLWASDWNVMRADTQLALVMGRLRKNNGGIVLFHDTKKQTAEMLPGFLAALKQEGFRVVHITP